MRAATARPDDQPAGEDRQVNSERGYLGAVDHDLPKGVGQVRERQQARHALEPARHESNEKKMPDRNIHRHSE